MAAINVTAAHLLIWVRHEGGIVQGVPQLLHEAFEQRVGAWSVRLVNRRSPHLPPRDQRTPGQQLDQLQIEGTLALECCQLLVVVQLPAEDVRLGRIRGHVGGKRVTQLLG